MSTRLFAGSIAVVGALVLLVSSIFVVKETERAVVLRFGKLIDTDTAPGLHVKAPFIDEVRKFDGRILTLDAEPENFYTLEKSA